MEDIISYYNKLLSLLKATGYRSDSLKNNLVEMIEEDEVLVLYRNEICKIKEGQLNEMRPFYIDQRDNVVRLSSEIIGHVDLSITSIREVVSSTKIIKLIGV